jgi:hypothetical protein
LIVSEQASHLYFFCEISLDGERIAGTEFALKGLNLAAAMAVMKGEFRAFSSKTSSDSRANSAGCAGDEDDFVIEAGIHIERASVCSGVTYVRREASPPTIV